MKIKYEVESEEQLIKFKRLVESLPERVKTKVVRVSKNGIVAICLEANYDSKVLLPEGLSSLYVGKNVLVANFVGFDLRIPITGDNYEINMNVH